MYAFIYMYLCDTVMGICDSYSSKFGYKSARMKDNVHHSTAKQLTNWLQP